MDQLTGIAAFRSVRPIQKGWSDDRKYLADAQDGSRYLIRLSDISQYDSKKKEYEIIRKYASLGFLMSQPVDFGLTRDGSAVYMLLSWVEGTELAEVLEKLPKKKQYELGREAGEILRKIHSLPLDPQDVPVTSKKEKKLRQLESYEKSGVRIAGDENAVRFVRENIGLIWREAPVYQHGDFHPGNLIFTPEGKIGVIDFNRWEAGDPYEEFYKMESFARELSTAFCTGQIDAYFRDDVPPDFWKALAVYVAHASLYSIKWAEPFGRQDIDGMVRRCRSAFEDYDDFSSVIPKWYPDTDF